MARVLPVATGSPVVLSTRTNPRRRMLSRSSSSRNSAPVSLGMAASVVSSAPTARFAAGVASLCRRHACVRLCGLPFSQLRQHFEELGGIGAVERHRGRGSGSGGRTSRGSSRLRCHVRSVSRVVGARVRSINSGRSSGAARERSDAANDKPESGGEKGGQGEQ